MSVFKKLARRASAATAFMAVSALAISGAATADDISNNLDTSVDATAEVMALNVGGANGTTTLYVIPTDGDSKPGCNLTGQTTLTVDVSSSNTAVAIVSPASVTFDSCDAQRTLTVTPVSAGSASVSLSEAINTTGRSFNLAPATFDVNVTAPAPANTAPVVTLVGVVGGTSYDKGSVPSATCQVTDAEDGESSFPATLSAISGPYASDGIGAQTAGCSFTDAGGLTASASAKYLIVDPTTPVIAYELTPATPDGSNQWYRGEVTLTWSVTELESPSSLEKTGCVDQNITTDQVAATYTCSATSAGGQASEQSVTLKRDSTAPVVSAGAPSGTLGTNDWYTSDVQVQFSATDATSGLSESTASPQTITSSGEGESVSVDSPAFTDNAGNTAATVTRTFKIDKTPPDVPTFIGGFDTGSSIYFGSVPAEPTCTSDDSLSGLASCTVTGYSTALGSHTMTATATDNAGNSATNQLEYTVRPWTTKGFYAPVDMGGVVNTVKGGSTVPLKFELFAGSTELTTLDAVQSFEVQKIDCKTTSGLEDAIEVLSTGGTSLRYDSIGGQFIQNWKTPTGAGVCYAVTMTAKGNPTPIQALFKTK